MKLNSRLHDLWKVPLAGLAFFVGFIPGGALAAWMGLSTPTLPAGADQATLLPYTLLVCLLLAGTLAVVSRGLSGGFVTRFLILFFMTWIAYAVNNYFEAAIFSTMEAASAFSVVVYFLPCLFCAAAAAWLFPPEAHGQGFLAGTRTFVAGRAPGAWAWRLAAAYLAFPLAYLFFGSLIAPIVIPYYSQGAFELALPGWDQILPVLALRSLLFLLACLPVLIAWQKSRGQLFIALSLALFMLVGGLNMLQAYWLPSLLRIVHSLEMLADEVVYAGALVVLLSRQAAPITDRPRAHAAQSQHA